ncbi:MAG TPA: TolC family protein [Syntrophorhabdaceae bacterium]|nr:TolC family protein [Syntrophorhabdaceae bacterium]HQM79992.1 TolC family protein [Syntrophorhabdaceae bacterium]
MFSYVSVTRTITGLIVLCCFAFPSFGQVNPGRIEKAPDQQNAEPDIKKLTLADCVILALRNNIDLKNTFLNRITQRFSVKVAENRFRPQGNLTFQSYRNSTYPDVDTGRTTGSNQVANTSVTLNVPTGGNFALSWNNQATRSDVNQLYQYNPSWTLQYTQPLLKNAGIEVATANLVIARINEEGNVLDLKDAIINTIANVSNQYRDYVRALRQLEIDEKSMETTKQTHEYNKAMVAAGRMAESELLQSEAGIASKNITITQDKNDIEFKRLTLLQTLNLDNRTRFEPVEETETSVTPPSFEEAMEIARKNRSDYLKQLQQLETSRLQYNVAKNGLLWDLSVTAGGGSGMTNSRFGAAYSSAGSLGKSDWNVGALLTIPLNTTDLTNTYLSAKVAYDTQKNNLNKLERTIESDVLNAIRNVEMQYQQLKLAKYNTVLEQKKFDAENEKMKVGRSSLFQLLSFQDSLVSARNTELSSFISYLNALTTLDQKLGTTLKTWNIDVKKDDDEVKMAAKEARGK